MKFTYLTRGMTTPQGKARVYYTGHPQDMPIFLEEIKQDILDCQNCAIYYDEEPEKDYQKEELAEKINQMQLVVIPITRRFLKNPSRAKDVEFDIAVSQHIPILPLLQEDNLEEEFNKICGDLQMLYKHSKDETALPFKEKLETFLSTVLVGDELAEKIRLAFDAYVFLSYRKKDRKYAQELMHLIHKNEICRDIAIWYDEFLVPGENFNDSIADAMKKCSIFALAVTPNVMEKGNYVMTVEYPEAVKAKKTILPIELVETDKNELSKLYNQIPTCANAYDEKSLNDSLKNALKQIALRSHKDSPEHDFFIGLAYLGGIDVEVNRKLGFELIKKSAEAGLVEAMRKLVDMLRNGEGTKRDIMLALSWKRKIVDHYEEEFQKKKDETDAAALVTELWELGNFQKDLFKLKEAKETYIKMNKLCKYMHNTSKEYDVLSHLAISYGLIAGIELEEGNLSKYIEWTYKSVDIRKEAYEKDKTVSTKIDYGQAEYALGNALANIGEAKQALKHYQNSFDLLKEIYDTNEEDVRRELAYIHLSAAGIYCAMSKPEDAIKYLFWAYKLYTELTEELGTLYDRKMLAKVLEEIGVVQYHIKDFERAENALKQSLEIRAELYEKSKMPDMKEELASNYYNLGLLYDLQGKFEEALKNTEISLEMRKEIKKEYPSIENLRNIGLTNLNIGCLCDKIKMGTGKKYYREVEKIAKEICKQTENIQERDLYARAVYNLALGEEKEQATRYFQEAFEIWSELSEKYSDNPIYALYRDQAKSKLSNE